MVRVDFTQSSTQLTIVAQKDSMEHQDSKVNWDENLVQSVMNIAAQVRLMKEAHAKDLGAVSHDLAAVSDDMDAVAEDVVTLGTALQSISKNITIVASNVSDLYGRVRALGDAVMIVSSTFCCILLSDSDYTPSNVCLLWG